MTSAVNHLELSRVRKLHFFLASVAFGLLIPELVHAAGTELRIYMAPAASVNYFACSRVALPTCPGLDPCCPVSSLSEAQALLKSRIADSTKLDRNVVILVGPGTYIDERVDWNYTHPKYSITIMAQYAFNPPVFDGCPTAPTGCPDGNTWFTLTHYNGMPSNIHIKNIHVKRYRTAIKFGRPHHGVSCNRETGQVNVETENGWGTQLSNTHSSGHNEIALCTFEDIGAGYDTLVDAAAEGAVIFNNSDRNVIRNNSFKNMSHNQPDKWAFMHGIYLSNGSERNMIVDNSFENISGAPIKTRNYSNANTISGNKFRRTGYRTQRAALLDAYRGEAITIVCSAPVSARFPSASTPANECPSWNTLFKNNSLDQDFKGNSLVAFHRNLWRIGKNGSGPEQPDPYHPPHCIGTETVRAQVIP